MKRILIIILICSFTITTYAQDIHYSQFYNTPLIVNPALTGIFGGDQRAMIIYRNQYSTVATPYSTYGASFDTRVMEKNHGSFSLGTGLAVNRDVAGDSKFGFTNVLLSISTIIELNQNQFLTAGAQGGFEQRNISNTDLIWDSQYDGTGYNSALSSQETSNYNQGARTADINTGVAWVYSKSNRTIVANDAFSIKLGIAYQHLSQQKLNLGATTEALYSKYLFHGESNLSIKNTNYSLKPSFMYQKQGASQELLIGTLFRYTFGYESKYTRH
jgi:type IX secretion system PorP/SprF family membrane protein